MAKKLQKRYILNLAGRFNAELEKLFKKYGLTVHDNIDDLKENKLSYIIIRDHNKSFSSINDLYKTVEQNIPIVSLSEVKNKNDFIRYNGKAIINESLLNVESVQIIIRRFFTAPATLRSEFSYEGILESFKTLKITDLLGSGYYSDLISADSARRGFNIISIKNYVISLISYLGYLKQRGVLDVPFEIDYGESDNTFLVQAQVSVNKFSIDYIQDSFGEVEGSDPFKYLFRMCANLSHIFDIYHLKRSSKVVFTAAWFSKAYIDDTNFFSTICFNSIVSIEQTQKKWEEIKHRPEVLIDSSLKRLNEKIEDIGKDPALLNLLDMSSNWLMGFPILIKKLISFVHELRKKEAYPKDVSTLSVRDVKNYIADYPNERIIKKLTDSDYELILRVLWDSSILKMIEENKNKFEQRLEGSGDQLDAYAEKVNDVFDLMDAESANLLIEGSPVVDDQGKMVIHGVTENITDESTLVKGSVDEIDVDQRFLMTDRGFEIQSDLWNSKKSELLSRIKTTVEKVKKGGGSIEQLESDLIEVVSDVFGINEVDAKTLVSGVLENSKSLFANVEIFDDLKTVVDTYQNDVDDLKIKQEFLKQKKQIELMSKVIDGLHVKNRSLSEINKTFNQFDLSSSESVQAMANSLASATKTIETKNYAYDRLKKNIKDRLQEKEHLVDSLTKKLEESAIHRLTQGDAIDLEELDHLRQENSSFKGLLTTAENRLSQLSENMDMLKKENLLSTSKEEMVHVREKYELAIKQLNNQKAENRELSHKLDLFNNKFDKLKEKISGGNLNKDSDSTLKDAQLKIEQLEQESRSQNANFAQATLKIKELNQKNIFLQAQTHSTVENSNTPASGQSVENKPNKAHEFKIKQLETINQKFEQGLRKSTSDVAAAKKELNVLKQENAVFKNTMDILDKKLAKYKSALDVYEKG